MQEMKDALLLESDQPVLTQGSACHTDGTKAYKQLASTGSALRDGSLTQFDLKLAHFFGRVGGATLNSGVSRRKARNITQAQDTN